MRTSSPRNSELRMFRLINRCGLLMTHCLCLPCQILDLNSPTHPSFKRLNQRFQKTRSNRCSNWPSHWISNHKITYRPRMRGRKETPAPPLFATPFWASSMKEMGSTRDRWTLRCHPCSCICRPRISFSPPSNKTSGIPHQKMNVTIITITTNTRSRNKSASRSLVSSRPVRECAVSSQHLRYSLLTVMRTTTSYSMRNPREQLPACLRAQPISSG